MRSVFDEIDKMTDVKYYEVTDPDGKTYTVCDLADSLQFKLYLAKKAAEREQAQCRLIIYVSIVAFCLILLTILLHLL